MRRLGLLLYLLLIPALATATGSLTIPNTIFTQPNPVPTSLLDANWQAIASYVNAREITFGLLGARPVAGTAGRFYFATDVNGGTLYADTGAAWTQLAAQVSNQLVNQRASLTLSNNGTATASFLVFPGAATSDDTTIGTRVVITLPATLTKKPGTAWAVGSGNGCLDTGAVAAFTFYHVFLITRLDTGVVDVLCSASATAPTMPANYTKKQRLGAIRTTWFGTPGAELYFFTQYKNVFRWASTTTTLDVNNATPGTGAVTATLSVPNGVVVRALINAGPTTGRRVLVSELTASDEDPANTPPGASCGNEGGGSTSDTACQVAVLTSTGAAVRYRMTANVAIRLVTIGWEEMWD